MILCERGIRTFEDPTRNTLDLSAVPNVKGAEPPADHRRPAPRDGRPDLIPAMARAAVAAGADGIIVEAHPPREGPLGRGPADPDE